MRKNLVSIQIVVDLLLLAVIWIVPVSGGYLNDVSVVIQTIVVVHLVISIVLFIVIKYDVETIWRAMEKPAG